MPSISTYSNLPITNNFIGDVRRVLDTSYFYIWMSENYNDTLDNWKLFSSASVEPELNINQYAYSEVFLLGDNNGAADALTQTFIPTKNGVLNKVTIHTRFEDTPVPGSILTVEIRETSGGLPTEVILATENVIIEDMIDNAENEIIFLTPISVVSGTMYAIVCYKDSANRFGICFYNNDDVYVDGQMRWTPDRINWYEYDPQSDLKFKIYIT
jgi:hypothetical protein